MKPSKPAPPLAWRRGPVENMAVQLDGQNHSSTTNHRLVLLFLAAVTLLTFGNLGRADFCSLDDPGNITANPDLNPPTWSGIKKYWTSRHSYFLYIPLTYTAWGALAAIAYVPTPDADGVHLNPWIFHSFSVLLHVGSALTVFAILMQILRNRRAACVGALFYALHPIQVEAVGWAAGLKDVLSGLLSLVALWQYLIAFSRELNSRRWLHYGIATIALIAAMLAKPSAMVLPVLAFVIDFWCFRRSIRRIILPLLPWMVLMAACAINARVVQATTIVPYTPIWARPFIVGDTLTFYLRKLIWPVMLAIDYGHRPSVVMAHRLFFFIWLVPAGIGITLAIYRKKAPALFVSALIFVATVAPVLGATPFLFQIFSTTADHYLYLAMLGPALAAGWLIDRYRQPQIFTLACVILVLLAGASIAQTQVWQNDFNLFHRTLRVNPDSVLALNNLGQAYLKQNDLGPAEQLLEKAVALDPERLESKENLSRVMRLRGNLTRAIELREQMVAQMHRKPPENPTDLVDALFSLGQDFFDAGRFVDAKNAMNEILQIDPDFSPARTVLQALEKKSVREPPTSIPATAPA